MMVAVEAVVGVDGFIISKLQIDKSSNPAPVRRQNIYVNWESFRRKIENSLKQKINTRAPLQSSSHSTSCFLTISKVKRWWFEEGSCFHEGRNYKRCRLLRQRFGEAIRKCNLTPNKLALCFHYQLSAIRYIAANLLLICRRYQKGIIINY